MSLNCIIYLFLVFFFFFKQKTAYEMRISDWSSDVCSSDLPGSVEYLVRRRHRAQPHHAGLDPRNRRGHDPHQRRRSRFLTGSARADDQRRRAVIDPRRIAGGHDSALEQRRQLGQTFDRALGARMLVAIDDRLRSFAPLYEDRKDFAVEKDDRKSVV